jgi:hypothetical protein
VEIVFMNIRNVILSLFCFFIIACGNYDSGYEDGYENLKKKKLLIYGRSDYYRGYLDGRFDSWCKKIKETSLEQYRKNCLEQPK